MDAVLSQSKLSSSIALKADNQEAKGMKLSDFYGALEGLDFPSVSEIREVMQDEDKDISNPLGRIGNYSAAPTNN